MNHKMTTARSFTISYLIGGIIVASTSPNTRDLVHTKELSFLSVNAATADIFFAGAIGYMLFCHFEPYWLAKNHVPSYAGQLRYLFTKNGFDFQSFMYHIFHQEKSSRLVHAVAILFQSFLWALVVGMTFGRVGTGILLLMVCGQAFSYGDTVFATTIIVVQFLFTVASELVLTAASEHYLELEILQTAKTVILWCAFATVLNHAVEPLPPAYHPSIEQFDDSFGIPAWQTFLTRPFTAALLVLGGWIGEVMAGTPGRLLNVVLYSGLCKAGHRSGHLLHAEQAKEWGAEVIKCGWSVNPTTAALFAWALENKKSDQGGDEPGGKKRSA
jgi:hypothetical protein